MPSPLASLFSTIDSTKRRAAAITQGLLDSPLDVLKNQLADVRNASVERADQTASLYKTPEGLLSFDPSKWSPQAKAAHDALAGDAMGAIAGATVYHGSPHKFTKFDSSKIGTGEGAQVYGHGIYLADSADVGKQYANALGTSKTTIDGKLLPATDPRYAAAASVSAHGYDKALADAQRWVDAGFQPQSAVDAIKALKGANIGAQKNGTLYTVDLPDPTIARMLNWDEGFAGQSPSVQEALRNTEWFKAAAERARGPAGRAFGSPEALSGQEFMRVMGDSPANASEILRAAGIPGVKYRDQFSRQIATEPRQLHGSGQWSVVMPGGGVKLFPSEEAAWAAYPKPTSNYVVFPGEEDALRILSRDSNFGLGPR